MKWNKHVLNSNASSDVDNISETIDAVFEALSNHGAEHFDFTGMVPANVNPEHLAAALRVTSRYRNDVRGWDDGLSVARMSAMAKGVDPDDLLYGMSTAV